MERRRIRRDIENLLMISTQHAMKSHESLKTFYISTSSCASGTTLTNDSTPHHPYPPPSPPLSHSMISTAFFPVARPTLPSRFRLCRIFIRGKITNPSLAFNLDLNPLHHPLLHPFPTRKIKHPLLVAPFPSPRWSYILEEPCTLWSVSRNTLW